MADDEASEGDPIIPPAKAAEITIPLPDLVWAMRNRLIRQYAGLRCAAEDQAKVADPGKPLTAGLALTEHQRLSNEVYPYTKGPDYANDLLAYGERLREVHWFLSADNKLGSKTRFSRRTRSGRTPENASESPTKSLDSGRPSQPPPGNEATVIARVPEHGSIAALEAQVDSEALPPSSGGDWPPPLGESGPAS